MAQAEQQMPPPMKPPAASGGRQTTVGALMKANWERAARITEPFPPTRRMADVRPGPTGQPVTPAKGNFLVVLYFSTRDCVELDRRRLVLRDGAGKSYEFGGWQVEDGDYTHCAPRTHSIVQGPWGNVMWDPIAMRPASGFLNLVYEVPAGTTKLIFTDGVFSIELDPILGPAPEEKKKEKK